MKIHSKTKLINTKSVIILIAYVTSYGFVGTYNTKNFVNLKA